MKSQPSLENYLYSFLTNTSYDQCIIYLSMVSYQKKTLKNANLYKHIQKCSLFLHSRLLASVAVHASCDIFICAISSTCFTLILLQCYNGNYEQCYSIHERHNLFIITVNVYETSIIVPLVSFLNFTRSYLCIIQLLHNILFFKLGMTSDYNHH